MNNIKYGNPFKIISCATSYAGDQATDKADQAYIIIVHM